MPRSSSRGRKREPHLHIPHPDPQPDPTRISPGSTRLLPFLGVRETNEAFPAAAGGISVRKSCKNTDFKGFFTVPLTRGCAGSLSLAAMSHYTTPRWLEFQSRLRNSSGASKQTALPPGPPAPGRVCCCLSGLRKEAENSRESSDPGQGGLGSSDRSPGR